MDPEQLSHERLAELFARIDPECVLDVGANAGQYGERLRDHGYRGWIVSFEPVHDAFKDLTERTADDERWRALNFALGAHSERRKIGVASVSQLSSFRRTNQYASEEFPGESDFTHAEEVEVRTLNDCWAEMLNGLPQNRVFLKIDTQGWDLEVLKGASGLHDRLVGVQLEASLIPIYDEVPTFTQTVEAVSALGFDLSGVFAVSEDSLARLIEVDCMFINSRHPDAERWREDTWAILRERFRNEASTAIPADASFLLVDDGTLGIDDLAGRRAIPFLERDGDYWGPPEDGTQAVAELTRQTAAGVRHVAVAWQSFWWFEEYPELAAHLAAQWHRVLDTSTTVVFGLDSVVRAG